MPRAAREDRLDAARSGHLPTFRGARCALEDERLGGSLCAHADSELVIVIPAIVLLCAPAGAADKRAGRQRR